MAIEHRLKRAEQIINQKETKLKTPIDEYIHSLSDKELDQIISSGQFDFRARERAKLFKNRR